jgi:hypothetical protein
MNKREAKRERVESDQPLTSKGKESRERKKGIFTVTRRSISCQGTIYSQSENGERYNMVLFLVEGPVWDP